MKSRTESVRHGRFPMLLSVLLLLFSASGCHFVWQSDYKPEAQPPATEAVDEKVAKTSWVELLWQVPPPNPQEAVDTYHINYGDKPGNLSNHDEVAVSDLAVIYHPKFGKVYQYRINDIPADQPIYISLQAENKAGISQPTATIRMQPGQSAPVQ